MTETAPELDLLIQPGEDGAAAETTPAATNVVDPEPYLYTTDADTDEQKRSYAMNFSLRKKPKSLFVMSIGMPEFAGILDRPPLSVVKRKELNEAYVPKAEDFKQEVKRRSHFFMEVEDEATYFTEELKRSHPLKTRRNKVVMPQPNQWLNTNLKKWLQERPMKPNDNDISFLQSEVNKAMTYLANESVIENGGLGADVPETPKIAPVTPAIADRSPAPGLMARPDLPADAHSYTSVTDNDEYKRSAAMTYTKMDSKPRVVIAMALGMIEYQGLLDRPPFSLAKRKDGTDDFMPRAEDYRFEIKRRAHFFMNSEEEALYFTKELKKKHPLENMRGVVTLPQPAQWKIQALRGWLSERPLKPSKEDSAFIQESIQKIVDSLGVVLDREKIRTDPKKSAAKMPWGTANAVGPGAASGEDTEDLLLECIAKQDAILVAVTRQTKQQSLLNKVTILNQAISGYQQEMSSLRSILNDLDTRIMTVEMKIADKPASEEKLNVIIEKQKESKTGTEEKMKELQDLIDEKRTAIEECTTEVEELVSMEEEEVEELNIRKRKIEETSITEGEEEEVTEV